MSTNPKLAIIITILVIVALIFLMLPETATSPGPKSTPDDKPVPTQKT